MEKQTHSLPTGTLIKRFLPYFTKHRKTVVFDLFCAALTTVCELVLPLIVSEITGRGEADPASLTWSFVLTMGGIYILLRIIDAAANYFMQSVGHIMGSQMETDMRTDLFHHVQQLSFSFFSEAKVGQIMARITSDLFQVTEFAHHCPEEFFIAAIKITVSFTVLCGMNIPLTLLVFAVLPFMLGFSYHFNHKMRRVMRERNRQVGEINAQVEDSLLGIRVVKSFANEAIEEEKFRQGNLKFLDLKALSYRVMAQFGTSNRIFDGLMYIIIVMAGALLIGQGKLTLAEFTAYLLYATVLLNSIRRIVEFTEQFQQGMTGIERFFEVMDAPIDIADAPDARELQNVRGEVTFDNVSFRYGKDEAEVLHSINLSVQPGQSIALVGPSGAGKTTLCNLLPRFYDVTGGRILIDGEDIRHFTQKSLRQAIGVVQQDVYLFAGTVYENIAYGKPGATREEVIEAAKLAGAHEFIMALPQGYDTYTGERGVRLSGGQKQRISIARALILDPEILILDDSVSAVDTDTEEKILQHLRETRKGKTNILIAHRISTLQDADQILVIDEGAIAECGTHQELLDKNGIYADMYHRQLLEKMKKEEYAL